MSRAWARIVCLGSVLFSPAVVGLETAELLSLSLEDLMNIEVTSVSKKEQKRADSAAAVFVLTQTDIRRSGARNIPDALRMVPGLHVARIDASEWAVTSRGLNGRFANKLLVLLDGRSVYVPSFSGVYWEQLNPLLEDIERIEVIRGPGATVWGANAVNGIINIITKHSEQTQGGVVKLGGGDEERGFLSVRYGQAIGDQTHARFSLQAFERDELIDASTGKGAGDDWRMLQGGFRVDTRLDAANEATLEGQWYSGDLEKVLDLPTLDPPFLNTVAGTTRTEGFSLLGRWQHRVSETSALSAQLSYDTVDRRDVFFQEQRETLDIDVHHQLMWAKVHDLVWGLGYRVTRDDTGVNFNVTFDPGKKTTHVFSAFIQDEMTLIEETLWLTVGSKIEHNDYSGFEYQPSLRVLWALAPKQRVWASVARAVRTPSRSDQDAHVVTQVIPPVGLNPLPTSIDIFGVSDFDAETLLAWEVGYRVIPSASLSIDVAFFYNEYDDIRGLIAGTPILQATAISQPIFLNNDEGGDVYGGELALAWEVQAQWRLQLAYSYLDTEVGNALNGPRHQVSLRSSLDLSRTLELDAWFRYVDDIASGAGTISDYTTLDVRVAWRPVETVELALVGQNLLQDRHQEFDQELFTRLTEIQRSVFAQMSIQF